MRLRSITEHPIDGLDELLGDDRDESPGMKLIWCVVRPESLEAVKQSLTERELIGGMTMTDVRGFGRQKGSTEHYRGESYVIRFLPKVRIEIVVRDEEVDGVMVAIRRAAHTGEVGDGKIFVVDVGQLMRIRTGDRGIGAL